MKQNRKWILSLVAAVLVAAVAIGGIALWLQQERLEQMQADALAELERNAGQYDQQSIVLSNTSRAKAEKLAQLYGAKLRMTENGRFATLTLPEGTTIRDVYAMKESLQYIPDMAADYQVQISEVTEGEQGERLPQRPQYTAGDPGYALQGYLDYLNLGPTWYSYTGMGITVAVIDTGIDTDHPEFAGRISEYSYNATKDKIVKDYDDWSLIEDEQGHGTAVAGVLAASLNGDGIVGIAPNADILVIKAECDENGNFQRTSDLVFGLYYAIERDVRVVNMSFGTYGCTNPFAEAVQLAYDSDIICVAAAGNDNTSALAWPAADEHVIGVGALDGWERAFYSNVGENVDLMAPGTTYTTLQGGGCGNRTGTSLASPAVAGALALLLESNPYTTFEYVTQVLYASCYDLGDLGRDWQYGFGALDVSALVLEQRGTIHYNMLTDELENMEGIYIQGHTLQELPEPERLYAVFDGWYYDDTFTQEYNYYEDRFYGEELTLYAKWVNEEDGIPYTYVVLEDGTVEIRSYTGHRKYLTIPERIEGRPVSSIGDFAFSNQTRLREVTLPSGLRRIGMSAFENCANLVQIRIPELVAEIGASAFAGNVRLSTLAFMGNSKLESIGAFAFASCGKLEQIELPASLQNVDGSAFCGATALHTIAVQKGNTAFMSKDGVLFDTSGETLVAFPAAWGSSYALPGKTTRIGQYAFSCANIQTVDLTNVAVIENNAFQSAALRQLQIPDGVVYLGTGAFMANENLTTVTIGRGLTEIGAGVFRLCGKLQSITIPNQIVTLDSGAFTYTGLQEVLFEENSCLTSIGDGAFLASKLTQIDIPASVQVIGNMAFVQTPLHRVDFAPDSMLRVIGAEAFDQCQDLRNIALPEGLETVGEFAFRGSGLTEVTVPASVSALGNGAFALCTDLTSVTVAPGSADYHDVDGVVYTLDNLTIHTYPAAHAGEYYTVDTATETIAPWAFAGAVQLYGVQLPEGLTQISEYGFSSCQQLHAIHIPDNVLQIGRYAFAYSWQLWDVYFNDTAKLPRLSYGAFAYSGITSFRVPANVSTIGQKVFEGCGNLGSITFAANSKLESISAFLFDGCENLSILVFEEGSALKYIQAHGLEGMDRLQTIDFGNTQLTDIDNFALRFCQSLSDLVLPETVQNIGRYAFYGCGNLTELTVPKSVEHIGSYAFLDTQNLNLYFTGETLPEYLDENWDYGTKGYYTGVSSVEENEEYKYAVLPSGNISILQYLGSQTHVDLTKVDLGGPITIIGGSAFKDSMVQTIVLPETLTAIQAEAFQYAPLESIAIPAGVTFIGREAFAYTNITSLTFATDSRLTVVEQYAFEGTGRLTSVMLPASLTTMGTGAFQESSLESIAFAPDIQLTEIPQRAFANTKLTSVTLPDSVTLVNHNAFSNVQTLRSVSFGKNDGIRLMSNAFYHTGLESLHIPENVTYIGEYCFVALPNLQTFTVDENNPNYKAVDGLLLTKNGRKLIAVPAGRTGSLTVPEGVEEIGFGAFEESRLSEISFLPDANILSFGYRAFFKAENITTIQIPKSVVAIDYYAFAYCENLKEVIFAEDNQLKGIYEGAFCGDLSLEKITVPDSIVEISEFAFYGCGKLTKLPLADTHNLKGIYDYAFAYTGLSGDFTTPETLWDIGDYAFLGCKFTKVTIPDTNKKDLIIGIGAFENCNQLEEITLPFLGASYEDEGISWLGYIFGAGSYEANETYVPKSLKTVTITEGISFIGRGGFSYCTNLAQLNLPHTVSDIHWASFEDTTARYELTNAVSVYIISGNDRMPYEYFGYGDWGFGISGHLTLAEGIESIYIYDCPYLTSVSIPNGAKMVEISAGIEELYLPDGVEHVRVSSQQLQTVRLPADLKHLTDNAFASCFSLKQIELPQGLETIGTAAFWDCRNLQQIVIPDSVTKIDNYAFNQCSALESVTLSASLEEIGEGAFGECVRLYEVKNPSNLALGFNEEHGGVANYARWIIDREGNVLTRDGLGEAAYVDTPDGLRFMLENGEYTLLSYHGSEDTIYLPLTIQGHPYAIRNFRSGKHIVLPEGMTVITESAFAEHTTLESIVIPETVTQIQPYAFFGCSALQAVTLPAGLTVIENDSFSGCASLQKVEIPEGVTDIRMYAFAECSSLQEVTLPESLVQIGYGAFRATALTSITLPASLQLIENSVFTGTLLEKITIDPENRAFVQKDGMLFSWDMTQIYFAPWNITEVVIPAEVEHLNASFAGCTQLKEVTFEENSALRVITSMAFAECTALETIHWPDSLEQIQYGAFQGCAALKELHLPDTLQYVEDNAFWNCTGLEEVSLPASLTDISASVFWECNNLRKVDVDAAHPSYCSIDGIVYSRDLKQIIMVPKGVRGSITIPEGVQTIPEGCFDRCWEMTEVILPESLTAIENYAFYGCVSLQKANIPESVILIGENAFGSCESLKEISVPAGVTTLRPYTFYGCASLETVVVPDSVTVIEERVFAQCNQLRMVQLPEHLTEIGNGAFADCWKLRYIHLPEGLVSIGDSAFSGCEMLLSITLPASLQQLGQGAFAYCADLWEICNHSALPLDFDTVERVHNAPNVFAMVDQNGNRALRDPDFFVANHKTESGLLFRQVNDTYILKAYVGSEETVALPLTFNGSSYVMDRLTGVRHVILPEGLEVISQNAFWGNQTLESVVIPDSVTGIESGAFAYCTNLTNVVLPDTLTHLGGWAFLGCEKLETITIGENLTYLGDAFTETAYAMDPANWQDGALYLGRYLLEVEESLTHFTVREDTLLASCTAFEGCHVLKTLTTGVYSSDMIMDCVNLETLILTRNMGALEGFMPLTLKNIVLTESFRWNSESARFFAGVNYATIFVEAKEAELRWDDNFPNWNLDLPVVYGENWIWANFYDRNGELLQSTPQKTAAIVRLPFVADEPGFIFVGWDLDGDGVADSVPATSVVDIHAYALMQRVCAHEFEAVVITEPGCTEPGVRGYVCTICGESNGVTEEIPALGHTEEVIPGKEATCTEPGLTEGKNCSVCEEILVAQEDTPALGHEYHNGKCTRCGEKDPDFVGKMALLGDINMDGKVNSSDVSILFRYVSRDATLQAFTAGQLAVADINQDGKVNSSDVSILFRYVSRDATLTWEPAQIVVPED